VWTADEKGCFWDRRIQKECHLSFEKGGLLSWFTRKGSITCSLRNILPCTCYRHGAESLSLLWLCIPCVRISRSSYWYLKLDALTKVCVVIVHGLFVRMLQIDMPLVLLEPCLRGMPMLSSVDITTFSGDVTNASYFQAEEIIDGPTETGDLPRREAYIFLCYILFAPCWFSLKSWSNTGQEGHWCRLFSRHVHLAKWIESMIDLPVIVAILYGRTTKDFDSLESRCL
jgi:hypothetical protein